MIVINVDYRIFLREGIATVSGGRNIIVTNKEGDFMERRVDGARSQQFSIFAMMR